MRGGDWRNEDALRARRRDQRYEDFGQADYSDRYRYDPETRSGYRVYDDGGNPRLEHEARSFDQARQGDRRRLRDERPGYRSAGHIGGRPRRDGPSDRVLWAVITGRLDQQRRLDLSEVDVDVYDGEVTLNGFVRRKADKRRIEDVADIEGVRNVQNNLRVRERDRHWTFF